MVQRFGTPYFGKLGDLEPHHDLTVGVFDNEIRRVVDLVNTTGADITYVRGQIMVRNADGTISALAASDFTPETYTLLTPEDPIEVANEAVGTGNGTLVAFTLGHAPVIAASLELFVNSVAVTTGFTLDAHRGTIIFDAPVTNEHAVVASYSYTVPPAEEEVVLPYLTGCLPLVAEANVVVPKKVGAVNGTATLNVLVKAELAKDMLYVGTDTWDDLDTAVAAKLENWLAFAGLVPADVVR